MSRALVSSLALLVAAAAGCSAPPKPPTVPRAAPREGVARALVGGAVRHAKELAPDARFLVALPRVTTEPVADGELWLGPRAAFDGLGFEEVHSELPYPVLRLPL
jgi:hypothetical protein